MTNQFEGTSSDHFTYEDYEITRKKLIEAVNKSLTFQDKIFLLNVKNLTPNWEIYDFERFPSVQWKLLNLQRLKETNLEKHQEQYEALKGKLNA